MGAAVSVETALAALPGAGDDGLTLHLDSIYRPDGTPGMVPAYHFTLMLDGTATGRIRLRVGRDERMLCYGGQVGYEVDPAWRGRRLAGRGVLLLLPLARVHGLDPLWFTCNPQNVASRRTLERVGACLVEIVEVPPDDELYARPDERKKCRFRLDLPPA